mmetsp:Transcript_18806/g.59007  ORF Transcript_18806/g.59007 Transcript_18806/m.59007 type:complete len:212 (-) Transcript_18806:12-647(-)
MFQPGPLLWTQEVTVGSPVWIPVVTQVEQHHQHRAAVKVEAPGCVDTALLPARARRVLANEVQEGRLAFAPPGVAPVAVVHTKVVVIPGAHHSRWRVEQLAVAWNAQLLGVQSLQASRVSRRDLNVGFGEELQAGCVSIDVVATPNPDIGLPLKDARPQRLGQRNLVARAKEDASGAVSSLDYVRQSGDCRDQALHACSRTSPRTSLAQTA